MGVLPGTAVAGKVFEAGEGTMFFVGGDPGSCMLYNGIGVVGKTAPQSTYNRVVPIDVDINYRSEIIVYA